MSKTQKKQSNDNISMPKKSQYQKALQYYGLQGKSAVQVSNRFGYNPTYSIKKKNGVVEKKKVLATNPNYQDRVEAYLLNKWKDDTVQLVANYNITFKKKGREGVIKFTLQGTKNELSTASKSRFEARKKKLEEDYGDEFKDLDYYQSGDYTKVGERVGNGIDNGKTITTTTGGQRKVGMRGNRAVSKMRDMFSLKFSGDEDQVWDRKEGTCVFDYLYWAYKDKDNFTSFFKGTKCKPITREQAYDKLNILLRGDEVENPLKEGVNVYQLENFCDKFCLNMYALDQTDCLISFYKPKKNVNNGGGRTPLMFKVFDGHFHPVNEDKRNSVRGKYTKDDKTFKSADIETYKAEKKIEKKINEITELGIDIDKFTGDDSCEYKIIAPTQEEYDEINKKLKQDNYPVSVRNQYAMNFLKKNELKIPFPLTQNHLYVDEGSVVKIIYETENVILLTEPIVPVIKKFYTDLGKPYMGQSLNDIQKTIWMDKYGFNLNEAPFLSTPNSEVLNALSVPRVKYRCHLGLTNPLYNGDEIKQLLKTGSAISVDITKCYCDALYSPRERWIVFNGKETLERYDGKELSLGLYFVKTDDMTLFHQSNWYSKQIILKAKEEGGIVYRITHQIRCVDVIWKKEKFNSEGEIEYTIDNLNLFEPIINDIVELTEQDEDFTLTKMLINSISGLLGKTSSRKKTAFIGTNTDDIWENWVLDDEDNKISNNKQLYFSPIKNEEFTVYLYGVETKVESLTSGLPMYIQILDSANIALYDMTKSVGGTCLYRKTDCIVSLLGKLPEDKIIKYPCSYSDTWGKYRKVDDAETYSYDIVMNVCRGVETPKLSDDWKHYDFNNSSDWKTIIETAIEKGGMLISGRAGTGKSYIVEKGIEAGLLPAEKETRLAPTNRAARNINGTTIHKLLSINGNKATNNLTLLRLKKYKIFIVDEISMLYGDLWRKLCLLKKSSNAIFIIMGDFRQCPPIEEGVNMDYFNHPYAKELANNNICELTSPQRYDLPLWNWLEDFYEEGKCDYDLIQKKKLTIQDILYKKNIVYYNNTREFINNLCMKEKIKNLTKFIVLEVPKNEKLNDKARDAYLYEGLPVMTVKNSQDYEVINSDELIVEDFNSDIITLIRENFEKLVIPINMFHRLFVVNYASTTHKNQGATVEEDINIFDWDRLQKDKRIGYTAISRAKSCGQLTIVDNYKDWRERDDKTYDDYDDNFEVEIDEDFVF